jgi:hypothetical protein
MVAGACIAGQSQRLLVRVPIPERASLQRLQDLDLDFAYQGLKDYVDLVVDEQQLGILKERGFTYQLLPTIDRARLFDPAYHTYEHMVAYLDSLHREYPEITAVHQIGASQQLHIPIYATKISDNAALDEDEFTVLYDGMHHAREPLGMECCLLLVRHLLENYGKDPLVTTAVNELEIWVVPILNPEGYKYIVDNDLGSPWWRKNQRDNNGNGRFDVTFDGVDLNRNYDYRWSEGGSGDMTSWTYRGPAPFSEAETQAKRDLVLRERFLCSISYHSYAEEIYYARGVYGSTIPETPLLDAFAAAVANRIPRLGGGFYEPGGRTNATNQSYPWAFAVAGVYELLIETGTEFIPPGPVARRVAADNLAGALYLLEKTVAGPGVYGHVRDAETGAPVAAEVSILEYDRPGMTPRRAEARYGRFHRFAAPGVYTLRAWAPGFLPVTEHVTVASDGWSLLDIALPPAALPSISAIVVDDDSLGASAGNGNGRVEAGETIELRIPLRNAGRSPAENLTATLVARHANGTVLKGTVSYGVLPVDSTVSPEESFVLRVFYRTPHGFQLPLQLQIRGAGGLSLDLDFSLEIQAPLLHYARVVVADSLANDNGALEPGEEVALKVVVANHGGMTATQVRGTLTCASEWVRLPVAMDTVEAIEPGQEGVFLFRAELPAAAPAAHVAHFRLTLVSAEKYTAIESFRYACVAGFFDDLEVADSRWWHEVRGNPSNLQDDWQWGTPQGKASGQDPRSAYSGQYCWGNDLGGEGWDGSYQANVNCYLNSPTIDCSRYQKVGLRFMRWLNVRAGDVATVLVNDQVVWTSPPEGLFDRSWTVQLVDISAIADGNPQVVVSFGLTSNGDNLVAGGWNIDDVLVKDGLATSLTVSGGQEAPDSYRLYPCYPNPFNGQTEIAYSLPRPAVVKMTVVNLLGQEVCTLLQGRQPSGRGAVRWDGKDGRGRELASGVYFILLEVHDQQGQELARFMRKVTIVR